MTEISLKILKLLKEDTYIKISEIEQTVPVPRRTLTFNLKQLIKYKRVETIGQLKGTKYKLSNRYCHIYEHLLYIYQNQILIGYLGYDYENYYFMYDTSYLLGGKQTVRFQMPIGLETYTQSTCFVDFEECLPEGVDRDILIEKARNATEFFLLKHNDYSSNDLIFSDTEIYFDKEIQGQNYLINKDKILGGNSFPNVLVLDIVLDEKTLFPSKYMHNGEELKQIRTMSLSGYQHKLQVIMEDHQIRLPEDDENVYYFVKPYHPQKADKGSEYYFPHMAINEHLHLTFAKNELGFDVPESGIFRGAGDKEYHYIIKYFDRLNNYKFQRKEFSTYMGLDSANKYNTSSEKLFETAAKVLPRQSDRLRMLEYYFYSFVIRHEDMHTKNISTICDGEKTFLAPLYDISSTGFYTGIRNFESHLPINGKQTNIKYNDFLELVKRAKVNTADFRQKAAFILQTYKDKMPEYIKKISRLENTEFYIKEKPNAQGKKIKIKEKTTLEIIMMETFYKRVKTLEKNAWFKIIG